MSFPIETPRLLIRLYTLDDEDVAGLHRILADERVMQYIGGEPSTSIEQTRQRVQKRIDMQHDMGYSFWAVVEKATGDIVGDCGLFPIELDRKDIALGFYIRRDRWGQGFATEAARACLEFGFKEIKPTRIVALVHPENMVSLRVLQKLGMTHRGTVQHRGSENELFVISMNDFNSQTITT
jgi:ribosomal-protein-alanine N-acetyltransferase